MLSLIYLDYEGRDHCRKNKDNPLAQPSNPA